MGAIQFESPPDIIAKFVAIDKRIDVADTESIRVQAETLFERWEFGRLGFTQRKGKQLPKGLLDQLVEATGKGRSELQYRMRFAERYPTEDKVWMAIHTFGSWTQVKLSLADHRDDGDADVGGDDQDDADIIQFPRRDDDAAEESASAPAKGHGNARQQLAATKSSVLDLDGIAAALEKVFGGGFEKTYTQAQSAKDSAALKAYAARLNRIGDHLGTHGGTKPKTRRRRRSIGDGGTDTKGGLLKLAQLRREIAQLCAVLEGYHLEDYDLTDDAFLDVAVDIFDDLVHLGEWLDRSVSVTQSHLSAVKVLAKIAKLRDTTGRTPAEAATAQRLSNKLEAKLTKRLP